jgi:hypothetical protein
MPIVIARGSKLALLGAGYPPSIVTRFGLVACAILLTKDSLFRGLLPTEWVKTGGFCELMPILKGFSLTWRSLANGMLGDAKIDQDKAPAG